MKSAYFTIHPGKNPPPQNGCRLKFNFFFFKSTGFTSSTFPIRSDCSQNQPAAITLNTGSPRTLVSPTLGPLHTGDREPVTISLRALSLVEKVELVQVRFTLRLRDQRSMWMQDGRKVYMDSYMASNGSCCMVTWATFKNHLLLGSRNTKTGRPWHSEPSQPLIYSILSCVRARPQEYR